jgi:hypothetical protein
VRIRLTMHHMTSAWMATLIVRVPAVLHHRTPCSRNELIRQVMTQSATRIRADGTHGTKMTFTSTPTSPVPAPSDPVLPPSSRIQKYPTRSRSSLDTLPRVKTPVLSRPRVVAPATGQCHAKHPCLLPGHSATVTTSIPGYVHVSWPMETMRRTQCRVVDMDRTQLKAPRCPTLVRSPRARSSDKQVFTSWVVERGWRIRETVGWRFIAAHCRRFGQTATVR